ncbi:MAG: hypothetical protein HGA66_06295, partial [Holophaga sp.]|nr:hypothetical protein [Holophaga sp.]
MSAFARVPGLEALMAAVNSVKTGAGAYVTNLYLDPAKAREWLARATGTNPKFAPAWSLLGDVERYEGNAEAADAAYSKAIAH